MKRVTIYFSNNKKIYCKLERHITDEVVDKITEGKHKTIALDLGDQQIYIVCDKVEFIEVKDI